MAVIYAVLLSTVMRRYLRCMTGFDTLLYSLNEHELKVFHHLFLSVSL